MNQCLIPPLHGTNKEPMQALHPSPAWGNRESIRLANRNMGDDFLCLHRWSAPTLVNLPCSIHSSSPQVTRISDRMVDSCQEGARVVAGISGEGWMTLCTFSFSKEVSAGPILSMFCRCTAALMNSEMAALLRV